MQAKGVGRGDNGSNVMITTKLPQNRREADIETEEIERLLKEIRILKNNHEL